ncbi:hypothetical protein G6F31_021902 [Rhizopus arrhizus]|nr:hypothetical protein G6F31_021902 [Rhizopus arrhizus]
MREPVISLRSRLVGEAPPASWANAGTAARAVVVTRAWAIAMPNTVREVSTFSLSQRGTAMLKKGIQWPIPTAPVIRY